MTVTLTWQTVITVVAVITAIVTLYKYFRKGVDYVGKPTENEKAIEELKKKHEDDIADIEEELTIIVYAQLACLKGLAEQGCDGPVHDAIDKLEKHLNLKAHEV